MAYIYIYHILLSESYVGNDTYTRLELLHAKFFLQVCVVPVMVQVISPLWSRFGHYLHFEGLQASIIRLGDVLTLVRDMVL